MVEGKFTKFEDAYIVDNYKETRDVDIAKRLNRTRESIRMRRKRMGLDKYGVHVSDHLNSDYRVNLEIRALENYSGSMADIATERLSQLKKKKVAVPSLRYREKVPLSIKANAYELYCSGMTIREAAKQLGRNKSVIGEWIKLFKPYTGNSPATVVIRSKFCK